MKKEKQVIRLTESDLKNVVRNTINEISKGKRRFVAGARKGQFARELDNNGFCDTDYEQIQRNPKLNKLYKRSQRADELADSLNDYDDLWGEGYQDGWNHGYYKESKQYKLINNITESVVRKLYELHQNTYLNAAKKSPKGSERYNKFVQAANDAWKRKDMEHNKPNDEWWHYDNSDSYITPDYGVKKYNIGWYEDDGNGNDIKGEIRPMGRYYTKNFTSDLEGYDGSGHSYHDKDVSYRGGYSGNELERYYDGKAKYTKGKGWDEDDNDYVD